MPGLAPELCLCQIAGHNRALSSSAHNTPRGILWGDAGHADNLGRTRAICGRTLQEWKTHPLVLGLCTYILVD